MQCACANALCVLQATTVTLNKMSFDGVFTLNVLGESLELSHFLMNVGAYCVRLRALNKRRTFATLKKCSHGYYLRKYSIILSESLRALGPTGMHE